MTTTEEIVETAGRLTGRFRTPVNLAADAKGSIHDDATAQRLGFRGGTVAGSVHMQQFPPILLRLFGERWFETGNLSCYFRNATRGGEAVRPFAERPSGDLATGQARLWSEKEDGTQVLEGTASLAGCPQPSEVERRLQNLPPRGETRILAQCEAGTVTGPFPVRIASGQQARQLASITEPLDWYTGPSPWGGPVVNPGLSLPLFRKAEEGFRLREHKSVGLFGAIEVRHLAGPMLVDRDYTCTGELLYVGDTPKSEYVWYRSTLHEGARDIASMTMMLRFMKASSDLWS